MDPEKVEKVILWESPKKLFPNQINWMKLQLADDDTDGNIWNNFSTICQLSPVFQMKYCVNELHRSEIISLGDSIQAALKL